MWEAVGRRTGSGLPHVIGYRCTSGFVWLVLRQKQRQELGTLSVADPALVI